MTRSIAVGACGALLLAGCAASSKGATSGPTSTTEVANRSSTTAPTTTTTPSAQPTMEEALPTAEELGFAGLLLSDTTDAWWEAGDKFLPIDTDDPGCTDKLSLFEGTQRIYDYVTPAGRYAGHAFLTVLHFESAQDAEEWAVAHQARTVQTCLEEEIRVQADKVEAERGRKIVSASANWEPVGTDTILHHQYVSDADGGPCHFDERAWVPAGEFVAISVLTSCGAKFTSASAVAHFVAQQLTAPS